MKKLLRLKQYVRSGSALEVVGLRDAGKDKNRTPGIHVDIDSALVNTTVSSIERGRRDGLAL